MESETKRGQQEAGKRKIKRENEVKIIELVMGGWVCVWEAGEMRNVLSILL